MVASVSEKYPKLADNFKATLDGIETIESSQRIAATQSLISNVIKRETDSNYNALFDKSYNVSGITPDMLIIKVSDTEAKTLQEVLKEWYANKYQKELPDITNISRDGNKLIIDAGEVSLQISKSLSGNINISRIGSPIVQESEVISVVEKLLNTITLKQSEKEHLQDNINKYKKVSSDENLKLQQKQIIIKTLKRLSSAYGGKREVFRLIKETMDKISEPNCI